MRSARIIMFLLVLIVLGRVPATFAVAVRPDAADTRIGWFLYSGGGGRETYDVMDMRHVRSFRGGRVDLDVSLLPTLSFISVPRTDGDETSTFWNFDGPDRSGELALLVCWWWGAGT